MITILVVAMALVVCCGCLWSYNKNNKKTEEEFNFKEAPGNEGKSDYDKATRKKGPSHQRMREQAQLDGGDAVLAHTVGSNGQRVFKDIGMVNTKTMKEFESIPILESPVINEMNVTETFNTAAVIPEDREQHPAPDNDGDAYAAPEESRSQQSRTNTITDPQRRTSSLSGWTPGADAQPSYTVGYHLNRSIDRE